MASTRRAAFCIDAAPAVGYGHLARCLTLADALGDDVSVVFCLGRNHDPEAVRRIMQADHDIANDVPDDCAVVVFDGYSFDDVAVSASRMLGGRRRTVVLIDDLGGRIVDCDLIVCPGPQRSAADYRVPPDCRLLLGPRFALINPVFLRETLPASDIVRRLFLGFGGSDPVNATGRVLPWLMSMPDFAIDLVTGPGYTGTLAIPSGAGDRIRHHHALAPEEMAGIMAGCDAAIAAPGTMSLELASLGRPALLFAISPAQIEAGIALQRIGLCRYGGDVGILDQRAFLACAGDFLQDTDARMRMVQACQEVMPGSGAATVALAVKALF